MKNSIAKALEYEEIYQELGNRNEKIFDSMKDVMVFCALIALRKGKPRKPIEKRGGEPIKVEIFRQDDKNIIDIIALHEYGDLEVITEEKNDEKLTIFEEYANAGMAYIEERFKGIPKEVEIRSLIDEFRPETTYREPINIAELVMESID
ncbi:DNA phosphorothioation-associated protein 4 [Tissierella carlieri]|uniref:DNA phosphorothioation-associated protein 4 n=1 Tax=Tissierella carlieri TaxID=689904 RepID=UPI001C0F8DA8|nr:DNA phosphorothioation-associated protein 4 [Tissierella carlieri]MBU5310598.1 DNA phosphorothioation-associated protein 4 [Tissierella carlieri]